MKRCIFAVIAILLAGVPTLKSQGAVAPAYLVEDLGTIDGLVPTVTGINAAGQIVGHVSTGGSRAVRYTDGIGWEYLRGVGTTFSDATGINAHGDVVGFRGTATGETRAFRYSADTNLVEDIPLLPGGTTSFGYAINGYGDIVGYGDSATGWVAFLASPGLPTVALPSLGNIFSIACGVNDARQVAGWYITEEGFHHAMLIEPGVATPIDIGSFDGPAGFSSVCAIDAEGRVGGQSDHGGNVHAFRYSSAGAADLDTFGSSFSMVESLAAGTTVGWFTTADGSLRAFANTSADGSFNLNDRLDGATAWVLEQAKAVNESGTIVGQGTLDGNTAVFRLTPPPVAPPDSKPPVISAVTASPSRILPPNGAMVAVAVSVSATDDTDPSPVCGVTGIDGHGQPASSAVVTGPLSGSVRAAGGARYSFAVKCTDAAGNSAAGSVDVVVPRDTTAPVITSIRATPSRIWPPDGRLVPVSIAVSATDNVDSAPACALTGITATDATADDAAFTGTLTARVRAVAGRTYTLTVSCSDAAGNSSDGSAEVVVPPDTTAPVISALVANPSTIWPPNGKMVAVSVRIKATDDVDASPRCALTSITGGSVGDARLTGALTGSVRSEKGNAYELLVTCSDLAGNSSEAVTSVSVTNKPSVAGLFRIIKILKAHKLHKGHKFHWHRRR